MGVDARAYLPNVDTNDLYSLMSILYDNTKLRDIDMYKDEMWYIDFGAGRMLTVHSADTDVKKGKKLAAEHGWDFKETDTYLNINQDGWPANTYGILISLNADGEGIRVINRLAKIYGGWFKPEDTAGGPYQKVEQDLYGAIMDVFI